MEFIGASLTTEVVTYRAQIPSTNLEFKGRRITRSTRMKNIELNWVIPLPYKQKR
jgi:hypothetical protein